MTGPAEAVAEYWRLRDLIARQPWGWDSPVNVQDWPPNAPGYSWAVAGRVDHCGLSMNALLHNIGLRVNVDFPNCAWTPSARAWADTSGRGVAFEDIEPGDLLLFRNAGSAYTATHIGMALSGWDGGVRTGEFNTDWTGMGREYWRTPGYLVAAGRPAYRMAPVPPPPPPPPPEPVRTARPVLFSPATV